jgi:phage FluMu protein Com
MAHAKNKHLYNENWPYVSAKIKYERANNKCERCGAMNLTTVKRERNTLWRHITEEEHKAITNYRLSSGNTWIKSCKILLFQYVVLTVAHLNHDRKDDREDNLLCLCLSCHVKNDRSNNRLLHKENMRKALNFCNNTAVLDF